MSNKQLPPDFIRAFNEANKYGIENVDKLLVELQYKNVDLETYFRKNISYEFDQKKKDAMEMFLKMII